MTSVRVVAVLLAALAVADFAFARPAQAQDAQLQRGEALLTRDCARCHAVGRTGPSPRADAPAFRTLGTRYPIDSLEEALGEGIVSGHPDMPEFEFDAPDVSAIIAYLKSIQTR
jgi:mono/diheme cytochrome c family protein